MFCKYEGEDYIPYDNVVRDQRLADVVDIKFKGLGEQGCSIALNKANWAQMPSLKKMVIHHCTVPQYAFPGQGVLTNLKEIEVSESIINIKTTNSLLTAAPNITKFSRDKNFFPVVKTDPGEERLRGKVELEILRINYSERIAAFNSFDTAAELRSIPVQSMKGGDPNSGETFVARYVQDEDAVQSNSDGDSKFDLDRDYISQTGTSDSDSERMDGHAVPSSSIGASSTLRNEIECRLAGDSRLYEYTSVDDNIRKNIVELRIRGTGPNTNVLALLTQNEWNALTQLKALRISNASITTKYLSTTAPKITLSNLTSLELSGCGIDYKGLKCLVGNSTKSDVKYNGELQKVAMSGSDYAWTAFPSGDNDLTQIKEEFNTDEWQDMADPDDLSDIDDSSSEGMSDDSSSESSVHISRSKRRKRPLRVGSDTDTHSDFSDGDIPREPAPTPHSQYQVYSWESEAGSQFDGDDDLDDDIPLSSRDSGHLIEFFIPGQGWVEYKSILSSADTLRVEGISVRGQSPDADATHAVDWSQFPNLNYLRIVNSTITELESSREKRMLFPNMEKIEMDDCRVTIDAVMSFWADSGEYLTEFTVRDPRNSQGVLITGQEQADFESMVLEASPIRVQFPPPPPSLTDDEDEDFGGSIDGSSESGSSNSGELFGLSPQPASRRMQTAQPEITCYFADGRRVPYHRVSSGDLKHIVGIYYAGVGHNDNAMETVNWSELTGLESLSISNASVSDAASFRGQGVKTLFPELTKMSFDSCKLGPKAIEGFVKHASSSKLQTFQTANCVSGFGLSARKIAKLKVAVNQRGNASMPSNGAPNRRSATGRANGWRQDDQWMESPGSNRSESSTPRNSNRTTIYSEDGAHNRIQRASSGPRSTGVAAGAATNRPSIFTAQQRGNLPSVRKAVARTEYFQDRFRAIISPVPELVVDNESANSRNYDKLLDDTAAALGLINQKTLLNGNNYRLYVNEDAQTTSIRYQHRDRMAIPILDASIDTVKVHRGWRQVDKTISHETRAQIVLASLGIPPCPPNIAISNERSSLGQAIRAEFARLQGDESEVIVSRITNK